MSRFVRIVSLILCLKAFLLAQPPRVTIPDDVIWEPALEYAAAGAKTVHLMMDVVRPRGGGPHPGVVCIHGGGFRRGTRDSYLPLCIRLAQHGYVAATVSYRLAPLDQFPAPVHDVKTAVRWLRAHAVRFGLDPDRIGVTGGSAGGHLALFLGLTASVPAFEGSGPHLDQSSRVSCVVNLYGPTDFTKSYGKSVDAAEVLPLFLGGDLEHEPLAHIQASPLNWVTPQAAPVLTIHGTEDRYVAYEQVVWLTDRLKAAGVEAELETLPGAGHGFKGADAERAEKRMMEFFDKHLSPRREERTLLVADHGLGGEILALSWPSGRILWRTPNNRGRDVQALPNGHVLMTLDVMHRVVELDRQHRVVWTYGAAEGLETPVAAQRLESGNTLIADSKLGKVIEVDPKGRLVWSYSSPDIGNMRMRSCRRTDSDTILIAVEAAGKVIEVNRSGEVIWGYEAEDAANRFPYQAHRLANGNTLISLANPGELVEVHRSGRTVRSIAGKRTDVCLGWVTGTQPLPDGGVLLADYTGRRILEIDASGKVVHQLKTTDWNIASISLIP
ncbi:MAG: alpha/beta hydrolase fold domain-containing protein [Acidobacteriota bacterium]